MQLPTMYQEFIHKSRYARWLESEGRRETWPETVDRYITYMQDHMRTEFDYRPDRSEVEEVRQAIINLEVMPSMRAMMTAGAALDREHVAGYNCSYVPVDHVRAFDETLYILMNGTGVGFSVEPQYVSQLPAVPELAGSDILTIIVQDSKEGWAQAYQDLLTQLWAGTVPGWDMSKVRPAGARLKTFGGRASGPVPLHNLFKFTVKTFLEAQGRQLTPLEAHDLMCKIADVVVVGGVRRSALISLGGLEDSGHAEAKSGEWWVDNGHRRLANNSVVYHDRPTREVFDNEWTTLVRSGSGERGIFNRKASQIQAAKSGRRDVDHEFGTNPCSEIILRPNQFCNLSEVVVRADDTAESLWRKVRLATILGTWQSSMTNFNYLRPIWRENTEAERLLGVSLTGQMDNIVLNGRSGVKALSEVLRALKATAIAQNELTADAIGIPRSAAITCVKPSGTVSQLVDAASGMHARHSEFWIRAVRSDKKDPLSRFMADCGVPNEEDVMSPENTWVFYFPQKAPAGALTRKSLTAIEQLEIWKVYQEEWCEHKPSVTVSVSPDEWDGVGEWVWENFDDISGVSFLPLDDHTYQQAPYTDCDEEHYETLVSKMPTNVRWEDLVFYESEDNTAGTQTLACSASGCEVVDLVSA